MGTSLHLEGGALVLASLGSIGNRLVEGRSQWVRIARRTEDPLGSDDGACADGVLLEALIGLDGGRPRYGAAHEGRGR